jgi:glycosyltransferase involved in cell wall biosynthesis
MRPGPSAGPDSPLPFVSVVIPTRNRPRELLRTLRAINRQSYEGEIECLVVFDQSDLSEPGVSLGKARTLRTLRNERSPGLAGARNSGILQAKGDIISFCDDDDEWLPNKLSVQVATLRAAPRPTLTASGIEVVYGSHRKLRIPPSTLVTLTQLLRSRVMELHPSTFLAWREQMLAEIGLVDERIPGSYGEDYELLLRSARVAPIIAVRKPLARVHWHRSSWFTGRWDAMIGAIEYLLDRYPEFAAEPRGIARLYGQLSFAHAAAGRNDAARHWAAECLKRDWRQPRAYAALMVSSGAVRWQTVLRLANSTGRGI